MNFQYILHFISQKSKNQFSIPIHGGFSFSFVIMGQTEQVDCRVYAVSLSAILKDK